MKLLLLFILFALIIQSETQAQIQPLVVPVTTPVSGFLVMSGNPANIHTGTSTNLFLLDTSTGNVQVLVDDALTLSSPTFDPSGDKIAFFQGRVGIQLYQISTDNFTTVIPTDIEVIDTESWSPDGNKITSIHYDYITPTNKFKYSLNIVDIGSGVATNLFSFMVDESLRDFPLPSTVDDNDLFLYTMDHALWNPSYEDWIAIQMSGLNPQILNIDGQVRLFSINVLYNLQTQQLVSLDNLFENPILTHSLAWSTDGQSIVLETDEPIGSAINIVKVSNLHGTPNLSLLRHADNNREVIASWLGIDDLLITVSSDPQTHDTVYSISQIINGKLYVREFFRLPDSQFATTSYPDFYLAAPQEEQNSFHVCLTMHSQHVERLV